MPRKPMTHKTLYIGDNLPIMIGMESNSVDLIYTDPPFNTGTFRKGKTEKHSFIDTWTDYQLDFAYAYSLKTHYPKLWEMVVLAEDMHSPAMRHYLEFMAPRIVQMHRLLKDTGSLYLHCDQNANGYLRVLLDMVFDKGNFVNEIIWTYTGGTDRAIGFQRKHDNIYFYRKSKATGFNQIYFDYAENTIKRFNKIAKDGRRYKENSLADGRKTITYMKEQGKLAPDYWHIPIVVKSHRESTGYDSQKPLALVSRIIQASSNEGDLVMDPFCGCATTCVAAAGMRRQWIGIDQNEEATAIFRDRLTGDLMTYSFDTNKPVDAKVQKPIALPKRQVAGYKKLSRSKAKIILLQQDYKAGCPTYCRGCLQTKAEGDLNVDHILVKDKGGLDELENYQLLCTPCNSLKGNKDMEFLYRKLDERTAQKRMKIINPPQTAPRVEKRKTK